jgi:hypothetical protein
MFFIKRGKVNIVLNKHGIVVTGERDHGLGDVIMTLHDQSCVAEYGLFPQIASGSSAPRLFYARSVKPTSLYILSKVFVML